MLERSKEFQDVIVKFFKQQFTRPDLFQIEDYKNEGRQSMKKGQSDVKSIFNAIKNDLAEYFTNPDYIFHEKAFEEQSPNNSVLDMGEAT